MANTEKQNESPKVRKSESPLPSTDLEIMLRQNLELVLNENLQLSAKMNVGDMAVMVNYIQSAKRIFLIATGRSGFAMRSAAMRLMHLGLTVYFVGETTTPAIGSEDLLIAASGSGSTSSIVAAAKKAVDVGADVVAITTNLESPLASYANHSVLIPAAGKQEYADEKSKQYAGSLFEQFLMLLMDAVFHSLWKLDGTPAEELWKRHANLE